MSKKRTPLAPTIEDIENRLIYKAYAEAERRLEDGTASSEMIVHFLRLGSTKAALEKDKLAADTNVAKAKASALDKQGEAEVDYKKAMQMFSEYHKGMIE